MPFAASRRSVPGWVVVLVVIGTMVLVWGLARPEAELPAPAAPVATAGTVAPSASSPQRTPDSGLRRVPESGLPAEAARTLALIRAGGPYPFVEDEEVFGNREGILPERPRGYYAEFTVPTPGEDDRGARRIVRGRGGDLYWTNDHYTSFRQIEEGR